MTEQKPSVGRIVLYRAAGEHEKSNGTDLHPAIINRAWPPRCVNLTVFPDCGAPFTATSVEIEDEPEQPGRWSWPPRD